MFTRRLLETVAMTIIGDSVLCMISPRRHTALWLSGPHWWQRAWEPFVRHPGVTRAMGAVGLGFGLWLAWQQEPQVSEREFEPIGRLEARRLAEAAR